MSRNIQVRRFHETDRETVRRVYLESRRFAFPWLNQNLFTLEDYDVDTQGETVWVAESGGEVLGVASVWEPDRFLHNLFVRPDRLGQGIGTALLAGCLQGMPRPITLKCVKRNEDAVAFYRRRGWVVQGEGSGPAGEHFLMALLE